MNFGYRYGVSVRRLAVRYVKTKVETSKNYVRGEAAELAVSPPSAKL